ncbi:failed axon connections-like isoform X2 [Mizuhopecten yessoensis]|uniref:Failed axon connection n=1 Tax=Mizuhopecten yessoensis TaxID=6573 RepID=A0A210Q904_MIZYE|nr:failed axon connections-like isoform X2 [Mizuhopecten yessoensis]OWF45227.1 Failed axon connection [Mizuhopecten yessoensis]
MAAEQDNRKLWRPEWKRDVVYLHVFPRENAKCLPNFSPYAMKLEMWLRLNDIPYVVIDHSGFSRKRQNPFILFNEEEIPDTNFIIEMLSAYFNKEIYPDASSELRAVGRSFLKMVEENTAWTIYWYRYVHHLPEYMKYVKFHDDEEMNEKAGKDLGKYVDCTLFAVLTQITCVPLDFPMMKVIREECPNLLDYIERLKVKCWPHWDDQKI